MSMPEINFAIQTSIFAVALISMAFRMKGNYFWHGITMLVAVIGVFVVFGIASPLFLDSAYTQTLTSPTLNLAVFGLHAFFGIATAVSGVWLVALWRPHSTSFPVTSKTIAKITVSLWITAYIVGIVLFVTLNTTLFG